jgi:hypothetical protein
MDQAFVWGCVLLVFLEWFSGGFWIPTCDGVLGSHRSLTGTEYQRRGGFGKNFMIMEYCFWSGFGVESITYLSLHTAKDTHSSNGIIFGNYVTDCHVRF